MKEKNAELIKYFIEHGADVNKESKIKGKMITPLYALCQHNEINYELIEYFVEHGLVPFPGYSMTKSG